MLAINVCQIGAVIHRLLQQKLEKLLYRLGHFLCSRSETPRKGHTSGGLGDASIGPLSMCPGYLLIHD